MPLQTLPPPGTGIFGYSGYAGSVPGKVRTLNHLLMGATKRQMLPRIVYRLPALRPLALHGIRDLLRGIDHRLEHRRNRLSVPKTSMRIEKRLSAYSD